MPIPVICACSAKLRVGDHLQGQHVQCPKCGARIPVGTVAAPPPVASPPSSEAVPTASSLSPHEQEQVRQQLQADERLVWADKPEPRIAFFRGCIGSVVFAFVAFVILVIVIMLGVMKGFDSITTLVIVVLGLVAGSFLLAGLGLPFVLRWRTFYAFTTRRALAWPCDWFGRVQRRDYSPAIVSGVQREPVSTNVGNLVFGVERVLQKTSRGTRITHSFIRHGFFLIRQPDEVERLLRETLVDPYLDQIYKE
jgi:hypothetical protein